MAVKKVKPTSPGRRFQNYSGFEEITKTTPEKSLVRILKKIRRQKCQRSHYQPATWRRTQALLPNHRLQAR